MNDSVNLGWKLAAAIQGWAPANLLDTYDAERRLAAERTLLHTRAQVALRRGHDTAAEALRELFQELVADEQPAGRIGAFIAGTDVRYPPGPHPLPAPSRRTSRSAATTGSRASRSSCTRARPVLLDLSRRADLREAARDWLPRVDVHTAATEDRPADALLIRPDARVAWAADPRRARGDRRAGPPRRARRLVRCARLGEVEVERVQQLDGRVRRVHRDLGGHVEEALGVVEDDPHAGLDEVVRHALAPSSPARPGRRR